MTCISNQKGPKKETHFDIKIVSLITKYSKSKGLISFPVTYAYLFLGVNFGQNGLLFTWLQLFCLLNEADLLLYLTIKSDNKIILIKVMLRALIPFKRNCRFDH